jgi:hypothetical protein
MSHTLNRREQDRRERQLREQQSADKAAAECAFCASVISAWKRPRGAPLAAAVLSNDRCGDREPDLEVIVPALFSEPAVCATFDAYSRLFRTRLLVS